jgi:hypothetical protein
VPAGVTVGFGEALRGARVDRLGGSCGTIGGKAQASVLAGAWDQFRGNNRTAIANAGVPWRPTDPFTGTFGKLKSHLDFLAHRAVGLRNGFPTTGARAGVRYQF